MMSLLRPGSAESHRVVVELVLPIVLMLAPLAPASARLVDGKRPGFMFGASFGLSPYTSVASRDYQSRIEDSGSGFAFQMFLGLGLSEHDVLASTIRANDFGLGRWNAGMFQRFIGPVWIHYFGPAGAALSVSVGGGYLQQEVTDYSCGCFYFCIFPPCPPYSCDNPCPTVSPPEGDGQGFLAGIGYEFKPGYEFDVTGLIGKIESPDQGDWNVRHLSVDFRICWF